MKATRKGSGSAINSFLTAAAVAVGVLLAGLLLLSYMVLNQSIGEGAANLGIPVLLLVSALIGGQVVSRAPQRKAIYPVSFCLLLIVFMVTGGFLIDGAFQNVLLNSGAVVAGSLISFAVCLKGKGKRPGKNRAYR